ncbi:hypothetical protein, partial [Pseudomonas frederiksbergensis]|uniref:hypothetical protein n=1 Tax=Pseudomonas frederiksbergensis TaxID=104087 RepID=UPI001C82D78E
KRGQIYLIYPLFKVSSLFSWPASRSLCYSQSGNLLNLIGKSRIASELSALKRPSKQLQF